MDFFDRQSRALKRTKWLVLYFVVGVMLMSVAVYGALVLALGLAGTLSDEVRRGMAAMGWWQPRVFLWASLGTLTVVGCGSLFKTLELSRGGVAVAEMLGGSLLNPHAQDPDERRLLNVVEEMALAAGVPVPQVYVLRQEHGINAFAAGHTTGDAVVGVTEGTLRLLTRDELQGVVAHEFSHILYGDMRLNLRLMGVIFGILCLTVIGRLLLQTRGGTSRERNALPILGLLLFAIGWVGFIFGRLIQSAVSRQREYLADASAVQFTRNPAGLAGALKKIGGFTAGSRVVSPQASEASHLFFGDATTASFGGLFSTHPPLVARIRAIDPSFDGTFPRLELSPTRKATGPVAPDGGLRRGMRGGRGALAAQPMVQAPTVVPNVGLTDSPQLRYARALRESFPESLRSAARAPMGACAIAYSLLLSEEEQVQVRQLNLLTQITSQGVMEETQRLLPVVRSMASRARLPLVDLALPQLRQLAPEQFEAFREAIKGLIEADEQTDLFEYVLQKVVIRHLEPLFHSVPRKTAQYYSLLPLTDDCSVLLSALAHAGHADEEGATAAFATGAAVIKTRAALGLRLLPSSRCGLKPIDGALTRLTSVALPLKKLVLEACARAVATDNWIQETEWELLRAVSDTLDCPLPIRVVESESVESGQDAGTPRGA